MSIKAEPQGDSTGLEPNSGTDPQQEAMEHIQQLAMQLAGTQDQHDTNVRKT